MTYQVGGKIEAQDYNNFSDTFNNSWAIGSLSNGWGQAAVGTVPVGKLVEYSEWLELFTKLNYMSVHQTGSTAISAANFDASQVFPVSDVASPGLVAFCNSLESSLADLTSSPNRFRTTSYSSDITVSGTHTGTWTNAITGTATVSFDSANLARWFFNAGGRLYLTLSYSGGSTPQDTNWSSIISSASTMWIGAIDVGGTALSDRHYWGTNGTIYTGSGTGAYSSNNLTVVVSGNGTQTVTFTVNYRDNHSNPFFDQVSGTFTITCIARPPGLGGPISNPGWNPQISVPSF